MSRRGRGTVRKTDPEVGYPLLKPVLIDEVRSGSQTLRLEHPVLGSMSTDLVVVGGEVSNLRVDVQQFPRAPDLEAAYAVWKNDDFLARSTPEITRRTRNRKALAVAGGAVAVVGLVRLGTGVSDRDDAFEAYANANDTNDYVGAAEQYNLGAEAVGKAQRGAWVFLGGAAVSTLGVSLTVHELRLTHARRATRPWMPEQVLRNTAVSSTTTAPSGSTSGGDDARGPPVEGQP